MVVKSDVVFRWVRLLRSKFGGFTVDDELRGWSWVRPPLMPRTHLGLSVYDVASYCPTWRDVWLRRVVGVKVQPSAQMRCGLEIHNLINSIVSVVRREVLKTGDPWIVLTSVGKLIDSAARASASANFVRRVGWLTYHTLMAEYMWYEYGRLAQPALLWLSEVRVDGTPLGLSNNLRIDALPVANIVVDFKVGRKYENHELMVTAYALALEANLEVPVDYGLLIYLNYGDELNIDVRGIYVGPDLRREFIERRDEVIDMMLTGREPLKARECTPTCPYLAMCGGAG